ncbi:AAA family ATPase [Maribellus comscasis]|uniref:AAA family ATPase n=1 Tax=Maribellus comscasis TaxID=2681766 RepID=A0A6I6JR27_9BACT|nr:AAA family ATPase [Maribellus comscasis]QGY44841.1 AAA family ATPase [Maribellus comscasis]
MKVRKIKIQNFRGIKNLDWNLNSNDNLVCLLGHGDSCKSSILKAIEFVFTPKWNLPIKDTDFFDCDSSNNIKIEITVGELSDQLNDELVAFYRYFKDGVFHNLAEKQQGDEKVVTVYLSIGGDLDPFWGIVDNEGNYDEEDRLSVGTRKLFNLVRLDKESHSNFSWKYDSPLLKPLSKEKRKEIKLKLVEIGRNARTAFDQSKLPQELKEQAKEIESIASSLAVGHAGFSPNVDIFSAEAICLHRGDIPMYMLGDGSQKIAALAIARYLMKKSKEEDQDGGFLLFDEFENSLEPHRLRYIISTFLKESRESRFQTFLVTHSSITVEELGTEQGLYIVRNIGEGEIEIHRISRGCIAAVRSTSEALFSKKIVICEGKTEFGLIKAFGRFWAKESQHNKPPEHHGVSIVDGKGSSMKKYLEKFKDMGYDVCVYKDNDTGDHALSDRAKALSLPVFEYQDGFRTEKIIFSESPKSLQDSLIDLYNTNKSGGEPVIDKKSVYNASDIDEIETKFHDRYRMTPDGNAKGMFRNIGHSEELGNMILEHWEDFDAESNFKKTLSNIEAWIYA